MERGFENGGVVRGVVGGLGGRCGGRVVGQDKASTVSHGAPPRFLSRLRSFSHCARTVRTVPTPPAGARKYAALRASIPSLTRLISYAATYTILIAAVGFAARKSGLVITLTDSSCPVGIYRVNAD